jgi:hypothetical protein
MRLNSLIVQRPSMASAGKAGLGGDLGFEPSTLRKVTTSSASCHRRIRLLLLSMEESQYAATAPPCCVLNNSKEIVTHRHDAMTFNGTVRGSRVSSARELHAQQGRTRECGGSCVRNSIAIAMIVALLYQAGEYVPMAEVTIPINIADPH